MQEKLEERQPSYRKRYRSKGKGFSLDTGNGYSFTTIQDTNELWGLNQVRVVPTEKEQ